MPGAHETDTGPPVWPQTPLPSEERVVERVSRARSPARHDRRHLKPRASPRSRLAQPRHSAPSLMAADALPSAQAHELVRPSERRIGSGRMSEAVSGDGHHRSARDVLRSWSRCWRGQPTHRAPAISAFCDHIGTKASLLCSRAACRQTRSNGARRRGWTRRQRAHARLSNQPSLAPAMRASPRRRVDHNTPVSSVSHASSQLQVVARARG